MSLAFWPLFLTWINLEFEAILYVDKSNIKDTSSSLRMKTYGSSRGVICNSKLEIPVINIPNVVCRHA
mgnify:CR=1 FL=1